MLDYSYIMHAKYARFANSYSECESKGKDISSVTDLSHCKARSVIVEVE